MPGNWEESKHPRAQDGKFGQGGGGSGGPRTSAAKRVAAAGSKRKRATMISQAEIDAKLAAAGFGSRPTNSRPTNKAATAGSSVRSPPKPSAPPSKERPTRAGAKPIPPSAPAAHVADGDAASGRDTSHPTPQAFSPERALKLGSRMSQLRPEYRDFMAMKHAVTADSSPDEIKAQKDYVGPVYRPVNAFLRGTGLGEGYEHTARPQAEVDATIKHLDAVLSRHRTTGPILTYRGAGTGIDWSKMKPGDTFVDKAYMSTSVDPSMMTSYEDGPIMQITSPKGTKIAAINSDNVGEYEMLMARGSRLRLDGRSSHNGREVMHLTVVDQE